MAAPGGGQEHGSSILVRRLGIRLQRDMIRLAQATVVLAFSLPLQYTYRASRSDSSRARISFSRTGPLTLRMMLREVSSMNSTRTWITPPREPVRPSTLVT